MSEMQEITVPVPVERVSEFYRWFADWSDGARGRVSIVGAQERATSCEASVNDESDDFVEAASRWWRLLNPSERVIWNMWIDAAPGLVSASEIVERLNLRDADSIRGKINRFAGKGGASGFPVGWQSHVIDPTTGDRMYGLRDMNLKDHDPGLSVEEYADVLKQARLIAQDSEGWRA
ncbi:hypothetical protein [Salinibacterium sp. ZJ77]|uniref:hypothetical protein n=1 Tax=Salinibacterium sp. ZJ77 TaxID=2708337 RepID=UPI0014222DFB|nr:hypothetical protein [Salinibacterium sp. ZJ77]